MDLKKNGSLTQFQFRASQFDLVIRVNLETTARLMFLSLATKFDHKCFSVWVPGSQVAADGGCERDFVNSGINAN